MSDTIRLCTVLRCEKILLSLCFHLQSQAYEFQFGLEYAWTMCIFAVSMTYSITCPIITPFGEQHTVTFLYPHLPLPSFHLLSCSTIPSPSFLVLCVCVPSLLILWPHSPLLPASPMQTVWICCCSPRHPDTVSCEPDAHSAPVSAQSSPSFYLLLQSKPQSERALLCIIPCCTVHVFLFADWHFMQTFFWEKWFYWLR